MLAKLSGKASAQAPYQAAGTAAGAQNDLHSRADPTSEQRSASAPSTVVQPLPPVAPRACARSAGARMLSQQKAVATPQPGVSPLTRVLEGAAARAASASLELPSNEEIEAAAVAACEASPGLKLEASSTTVFQAGSPLEVVAAPLVEGRAAASLCCAQTPAQEAPVHGSVESSPEVRPLSVSCGCSSGPSLLP